MKLRRALLVVVFLAAAAPARAQTLLRFPANDPKGVYFRLNLIIHVDHDPEDKPLEVECVNYNGQGFPWCYDQHEGTDFLLINGFGTMNAFDVEVVAAADGVVTKTVDGNYDRCHADGMSVSCDGHPMASNHVVLRHPDGIETFYHHLKKGSVKVTTGQQVACGDVLGYVGSSGMSAMPHLHFEVHDNTGAVLDPYAGPKSQPQSYWTEQQGPLGLPGERCQGDPVPGDTGVGHVDAGGAPDSSLTTVVDGPVVASGDGSSDDPPLARTSGCTTGNGRHRAAVPLLLVLLLFLCTARRRRS